MLRGKVRFGLYEFDFEALELRREGVAVRLQAQPKQVLACLVEKAGRIVTREELRQAIWGSETFVDFERGLNFCISQVRSALRDDAANPAFIRTVPKQGYEFIAPVIAVASSQPAHPIAPSLGVIRVGHPRVLATAAVVLLIAAFAFGYWVRSARASRRAEQKIVAVVRFDNETGDAALTRFADALTDNVVVELTKQQVGSIIGNAQVLRLPREQRDLNAIARELHARYIILGQVQGSAEKARILAHLIRMPEQAHISVTKVDTTVADALAVEADVAARISGNFTLRLTADSPEHPLPALGNR